jgi:hypothetical protein
MVLVGRLLSSGKSSSSGGKPRDFLIYGMKRPTSPPIFPKSKVDLKDPSRPSLVEVSPVLVVPLSSESRAPR